MESSYGKMLLNAIEEYDRDAAEARLVLSFGCTLLKDGNMWCCMLGPDLMEGHAVFSETPMSAIEKMRYYIYKGKDVEAGK